MIDTPPILQLEDVCLHDLGERRVLQNCHWEMPAGTRIRLSPGANSTAFLKLCAGILNPESGAVSLHGKALGPYSFNHPFIQKGLLGWLPTDGGLLVNLNLRSNLALPLRFLRGLKRSKAEAKAQTLLEEADLGPFADLRPHSLEPRQRWITGLLRAACLEPALWLIDHPPGLEEPERSFAMTLLQKGLESEKVSLIFACHGEPFTALTQLFATIHKGRMNIGGPLA